MQKCLYIIVFLIFPFNNIFSQEIHPKNKFEYSIEMWNKADIGIITNKNDLIMKKY